MLGRAQQLVASPWPKYDAALAKEDEIEIPVQVNGKLRGKVLVSAEATEDLIKQRALADEKVKTAMRGKQTVKVIFVPGKLLNFVVR